LKKEWKIIKGLLPQAEIWEIASADLKSIIKKRTKMD
jgi:hypothetical protein